MLLWLAAAAALAVVVAYQTVGTSASRHSAEYAARADVPTVLPGVDVLAGIAVVPVRLHRYDYLRAAFGDAWDDDNDAPLGHNGCDTRDDILNRDLVDKTYVSIKRCPDAVATGTLHDPYTNKTIAFARGPKVGESVQIDHVVSVAPMEQVAICPAHSMDDMTLSSAGLPAASPTSGEHIAHLEMS